MTKSIATALAAAAVVPTPVAPAPVQQDGPRTIDLIVRRAALRRRPTTGGAARASATSTPAAADCATPRAAPPPGACHWTCVYLGSTRAGSDCTAVVRLPGGTLQAAGALSHTSREHWAITGGTGAYAGARGTVRLPQRSASAPPPRSRCCPEER